MKFKRPFAISLPSRSDPPSRDDLQSSNRRLGANQFTVESRSVFEEDFLSPSKTPSFLFDRPYKGLRSQSGTKKENIVHIRHGGGERSRSLKIPFHTSGIAPLTAAQPKSRRRYSQEIPNSLRIPDASSSSYLKEHSCMTTSWNVSQDTKTQPRFDL